MPTLVQSLAIAARAAKSAQEQVEKIKSQLAEKRQEEDKQIATLLADIPTTTVVKTKAPPIFRPYNGQKSLKQRVYEYVVAAGKNGVVGTEIANDFGDEGISRQSVFISLTNLKKDNYIMYVGGADNGMGDGKGKWYISVP